MAVQTVGDLIDLLQTKDRNAPLRAAVQPSYPMAASVVGLANSEPEVSYDDDDNEVVEDDFKGVVFIVISDNEDYGPGREMWRQAEHGW